MIENKEKIVRDLIDTFEHRNHLHMMYKKQIKDMLMQYSEFIWDIVSNLNDERVKMFNRDSVKEIIEKFVEMVIRKEDG